MSEQTPFKKRLTTILKPDRRLSPLNPQAAAVVTAKIQESPPQSPLAVLLSSDSDSYSLPQVNTGRKKSVGLNLRKLAANEKPITALTTTKPVVPPKATILQTTTILDNPTYRHRFLNEPRSHWLFRSTSLTELPKWSGLYEETIFKKKLEVDEDVTSPHSTDSPRKRTLSHQPFERLSELQANARSLDAIPSVARLEKFAASLTAWDIELYTSIIETSRRAKNFLWKADPVAIWPDWHEGLGGASNSASPMPSYLEIKYDPPTPNGISRPPSRGRSNNSPVLTPFPMNRDRSMSPGFSLDPDRFSDSDSYSERGDPSRTSRRPASKLRKNLSISTKNGSVSPGKSPDAASSEFKHTRSHSDGDLTEYLKGFSNLKTSLQVAQVTCNNEIKKILDELQYHVEKGIEVLRKENSRPSTTTVDLVRSSLSNSKSSLIAVYQRDSARNSTVKLYSDLESFATSSNCNLTGSESSKLDTIASANSADQSKLEIIASAGLEEPSLPFSNDIPETTPKPTEKRYHKKTKSDSIKLAMDLKLDSSQSSQDDMPTESPFMKAISSVISVAHNILNLDIPTLLTPQIPQKYIFQIQKLQQLWTENPEWQLQELVVRLLIVFAGVVRLVDHFDEDFRSWNSITNNLASPGRNFFVESRGRRSSHFSSKSSPHESPSSFSFKRGSYSSAGAGADSSDFDEATYDSEASRESPSRRNPAYVLFTKGFKPAVKSVRSFGIISKSENASQSAFRAAVDEEQSLNVLLEHNSDGIVTYISSGVKKIFLYSPDDILQTKTIPFLQDSPTNVFLEATLNSTKQKPNLQLCIDSKRADGRSVKIECNGLVTYSESEPDQIKNVVWIIRPVKVVGNVDFPTLLPSTNDESREECIPNVDLALCNICDRSVPAIHFAVHSEICVKVHKTEMELVLMNDELRNLKQSAEDRLSLINEEIAAISTELSNCDDIVPSDTKIKYLTHLKNLRELTISILAAVDDALSLKIPKDDPSIDTPAACQYAVWNCPNEKAFLPEFVNDISTENSLLSDDLYSIGNGCYVLGKSVQNCSEQKSKLIEQMKMEFGTYSECLQTEQQLMMEIEIQTSKNSNLDLDVNEDSKFEIKEVGGVMVKIPSVLNLKDGYGSSPKDSILVLNSGDPITQTNSPPTEYEEPSAPPKILKRPSKQNSLRIQTFHESSNENSRRTSLRNPRMVVGDKSLEIESMLSPVLSSSSGNLRRNSFLPVASSSFPNISPLIGSPMATLPSIKDYELVKAISKGAFGSVFLAKKKITGLYYAIKVLRKADMVAKNQVSNIKSERTILTQLDSPYVVKLYSTFQSRNHIYLVMEFLNGGDCAALLKAMGQFDEPWAKQYITEMIQGLEFLHLRDIVHRDLKPDNILIDTTGHVKLTDFGLSKAGFIGRRAIGVGDIPVKTPEGLHSMSSVRGLMNRRDSIASVSSNDSSAGLGSRLADRLEDKGNKKLVGTPDYLAPESILGLGQGTSVDWWAVGVILYEFLHGVPPFNAATPHLVFENILMRRIEWDEEIQISTNARQLMDRFMCADVEKRLGTRGAAEVKAMEWFEGTDWENLIHQKVFFVPTVKNIEDTDYFDSRGAHKPTKLSDSDEEKSENGSKDKLPSATATEESGADFGEAVYKNLPLLEKANLKMMSKINQDFPEGEQWLLKRRDSLPIQHLGSPTLSLGSPGSIQPPRSISPRHFSSIVSSRRDSMPINPQSSVIVPVPISSKKKMHQPSSSLENLSRTSSSSLEARVSPSPLSDMPRMSHQGFSQSALKGYESDGSLSRSSSPDQSFKKRSQAYLDSAKQTLFEARGKDDFSDDAVCSNPEAAPLDVLIAESNPVAAQILETILRSLNCRCVRVKTGGDVVQCALGEIKFDIIFVDVNLPVLTGDAASRMIKATANTNMNTPVIALATNLENTTFSDFNHVLLKPVTRINVEGALQALNLL